MIPKEMVILLIEDDPDHARLVTRRVRQAEAAVVLHWCSRVDEALALLQNQPVDAVLLDLNLPDAAPPQQVVTRVKEATAAPIVVLTALDDQRVALTAVQAGAQDYLIKSEITGHLLLRSVSYAIERQRTEADLRDRESRLKLALEGSRAGIWDVYVDPARPGEFAEMFLSPRQRQLLGLINGATPHRLEEWQAMIHADDLPIVRRAVASHLCGKSPLLESEFRVRSADGRGCWLYVRGTLHRGTGGQPDRWTGISWDVTEQKRAEQVQARLAAIVECSDDAIIGAGLDGTITDWNRGAERLYGAAAEQMVGQSVTALAEPKRRSELEHVLERLRRGENVNQLEMIHGDAEGRSVYVSMTASPMLAGDGRIVGISAIVRDITERKRLEEQLHHDAFHDALTGLPNRTLFRDRLEHVIARAERHNEMYAVLVIDLDNFKLVNDSLGHLVGDQLLVKFARRLQECLRPIDTLARFGGDEFTVLLEDVENFDTVEQVVERIHYVTEKSFTLEGRDVYTGASIGVALSDKGYRDAEAVLRDADTALYSAKRRGKSCHVIFDKRMREEAVERLRLETELRQAILNGQIGVSYQPIVALHSGEVIGCEALARWEHPVLGAVEPDEFIALAEETGLIFGLGDFVLSTAARDFSQWYHSGYAPDGFYLSINLSPKQFMQATLTEQIFRMLDKYRIPGRNLRLEITESLLMKSDRHVAKVCTELKSRGIRICMDDFGTGYSSLSCLHRFPVDVLKVDRSFIQSLANGESNREILRTIVMLAESLDMEAVAEGADCVEHLNELSNVGFKWVQGFLFHQPQDRAGITALLERSGRCAVAGGA